MSCLGDCNFVGTVALCSISDSSFLTKIIRLGWMIYNRRYSARESSNRRQQQQLIRRNDMKFPKRLHEIWYVETFFSQKKIINVWNSLPTIKYLQLLLLSSDICLCGARLLYYKIHVVYTNWLNKLVETNQDPQVVYTVVELQVKFSN